MRTELNHEKKTTCMKMTAKRFKSQPEEKISFLPPCNEWNGLWQIKVVYDALETLTHKEKEIEDKRKYYDLVDLFKNNYYSRVLYLKKSNCKI